MGNKVVSINKRKEAADYQLELALEGVSILATMIRTYIDELIKLEVPEPLRSQLTTSFQEQLLVGEL